MTRTRAVRKTSFTLLAAAAIGTASVAVATATPENPSAATTSAVTVVPAGPQVSGPAGSPSGTAATVADPVAAATPAQPQADQVSLLDLLPTPLNCLLSTGYALLCLGVPLP
ncbi:hypothetical protein [Nocardia africana]|uniref:Uncharacterized protein n=2 Tax=Nocardia africana TaxID=134964 RepID=A0A378X3V8_9NOCA|nr:hypothetical protein [Nocardia africana]SUA48276.1 Uncharacterised protein [Nocardia africana]